MYQRGLFQKKIGRPDYLRKGLIQNRKDFILEAGKDFTFIDEKSRV
jgi:predicted nuclease of restriction endonuclease-like (RecB) superfamily